MGILMVVLLVASVFVPVEIPYTFESTAKVYPVQQWVLHKNRDGNLIKSLHNYKTGLLADYGTYQFDRGDIVQIAFNPNKIAETKVDSGELIATIASVNLAEKLVKLQNELSIERANLDKVSTGEKVQIVNQAEEELNKAYQNNDFQRKNYNRAQKLFRDGLISQLQYEQAEAAFKQSQIEIELAKKKIRVTNTGEKREEIKLTKAKIKSLENEIDFFTQTSDSYAIHTPITGKISYETGVDGDKLIVEDTAEHILIVPIKLKDKDFVGKDTRIQIDIMGSDTLVDVELVDVSDKVEILNRDVVVLAKVKVSGTVPGLSTGMPVKCKITCGKVLPIEYMKRSIGSNSK